jgi:D-sedoheptulose 7-phosphate isomerase
MTYPEQYRTDLVASIQSIDLDGVTEAIELFREARAHGHRIFICGSGSRAAVASRLLCDMLKGSSLTRSPRFRILALSEELPEPSRAADDPAHDLVFVEQLKNTAESGDVIVGISPSGNSPDVLRAFEYANRIRCRTISITGRDGGKLAAISNVAILARASHLGSVEDVQMILCQMIGYYFVNFEKG